VGDPLGTVRGGAFKKTGFIVGKKWGRFVRFNRDGFVLLFAPIRTGKGYSVVIPNLKNGFEVCSPNRVAIWHSEFVEATRRLGAIVDWLDGSADDGVLAGTKP
jgi:Type IV secretory system Conjugative DNA transfer